MTSNAYAEADYGQPHIPPATPPAIDPGASAEDAATLPDDQGDSDAPGSRIAGFDRTAEDRNLFDGSRDGSLSGGGGNGGDRDYPGQQPDEVAPEPGDNDVPGQTPDEVAPDQGDFDQPDSSPIESPPLPGTGSDTAPFETPMPPD
jgi:hypothetical protein